jgi:hypothetical protein
MCKSKESRLQCPISHFGKGKELNTVLLLDGNDAIWHWGD